MNMKTALAAGMIAASFAAMAKTSTPEGWTDDYEAALKEAEAGKKYVIADFSGSDWCGWCKKLEQEILSTETFRKGAVGRYELVYIDNPRNKDLLSEHGKENNRKLTSKYDVHGFPTVLILDADGKKVAEMGYDDGGPAKYLEKLEEEVKYGPDIKKYIDPIEEKLNGPEKAMQKEMQEAMKRIAKKYVEIYEKAFTDARAMNVPAHMEERKTDVISKQEKKFKRLKSFVEEKKD